MNPRQLPSDDRQVSPQPRPQSGRPPIEWPVRDTQGSTRAAELARQNVERVYNQYGEPNQPEEAQPVAATTEEPAAERTMRHQQYDWQKYHTAWQQYYQQYFYKYYANWWQNQAAPAVKAEIAKEVEAKSHPTGEEDLDERAAIAKELRQKIRNTVGKQAKRVKDSSHFKPILAALSVGAIFLFINYNQVLVGALRQYVAPGNTVTTPVIVETSANVKVGPEPKMIIPKIGVDAAVVFDEPRVDEASYQAALDRGVVRLGNSPDPGVNGNTVIGGHSSNNIFNLGKYKFVFVNLKHLKAGDIIYINFNSKRYTYKVTRDPFIVAPTQVNEVLAQTPTPTLTLFTCDPPGANVNRLIIKAEQIDPDPKQATKSTVSEVEVNQQNPLPSVAPSIWDRIFGR